MELSRTYQQRFYDNPSVNPETRHRIKIGGPTYQSLVRKYGEPPSQRSIAEELSGNAKQDEQLLEKASDTDLLLACKEDQYTEELCQSSSTLQERLTEAKAGLLTGDRNKDLLLLEQLQPSELLQICEQSSYASQLCQSNSALRRRLKGIQKTTQAEQRAIWKERWRLDPDHDPRTGQEVRPRSKAYWKLQKEFGEPLPLMERVKLKGHRTTFLTNVPEVDLAILSELEDLDFIAACQSSQYALALCQNDYFLRQRLPPELREKFGRRGGQGLAEYRRVVAEQLRDKWFVFEGSPEEDATRTSLRLPLALQIEWISEDAREAEIADTEEGPLLAEIRYHKDGEPYLVFQGVRYTKMVEKTIDLTSEELNSAQEYGKRVHGEEAADRWFRGTEGAQPLAIYAPEGSYRRGSDIILDEIGDYVLKATLGYQNDQPYLTFQGHRYDLTDANEITDAESDSWYDFLDEYHDKSVNGWYRRFEPPEGVKLPEGIGEGAELPEGVEPPTILWVRRESAERARVGKEKVKVRYNEDGFPYLVFHGAVYVHTDPESITEQDKMSLSAYIMGTRKPPKRKPKR